MSDSRFYGFHFPPLRCRGEGVRAGGLFQDELRAQVLSLTGEAFRLSPHRSTPRLRLTVYTQQSQGPSDEIVLEAGKEWCEGGIHTNHVP